MLNTLHTRSEEENAWGAIKTKQIHTPVTQYMLMSSEDLRFIIRAMSGIFQNGNIIAAIRAMVCFIFYASPANIRLYLLPGFCKRAGLLE